MALQENIHPVFDQMLSRKVREEHLKQSSKVLWLTGLSGSGKSTILKLIANILKPTSGTVTVNGSLSALLELGAGFHPDLTGRENVYINAAILGMRRRDVNKRFNDIVRFSELEKFIDTPVKHYSSGMYMRLGFSVAINVDPDILLVDEVLAGADRAGDHVAGPVDELGQRVDHHVRAEHRRRDHHRGEGVVHHQLEPAVVGQARQRPVMVKTGHGSKVVAVDIRCISRSDHGIGICRVADHQHMDIA